MLRPFCRGGRVARKMPQFQSISTAFSARKEGSRVLRRLAWLRLKPGSFHYVVAKLRQRLVRLPGLRVCVPGLIGAVKCPRIGGSQVLPVGRPRLLEELRGATVLAADQQRRRKHAPHLRFEDRTGDRASQAPSEQADRIGRVLAIKEHLNVSAQA